MPIDWSLLVFDHVEDLGIIAIDGNKMVPYPPPPIIVQRHVAIKGAQLLCDLLPFNTPLFLIERLVLGAGSWRPIPEVSIGILLMGRS